MSEKEAKTRPDKSNSSSMPTHTEEEVPVEVALAILYRMANLLPQAEIMTGNVQGQTVTYIRLVDVAVDPSLGFVLALPQSVGTPAEALAESVGNG